MASNLPQALQKSLRETRVSYQQLGNSGLRVSMPVLGCMSFGSKSFQPWVESDEDQVHSLLKEAFDCGLNTWDTANVYSNGVSERLIGAAIKKYEIPRHKLVLMTKCGSLVGEGPEITSLKFGREMEASKDYVNQGGLSRAAIIGNVNASLERLDTTYLDLLQIHRYDYNVPIEETMKALHDLVESGKVRYIGASSMWAHQFVEMQHCADTRGWTKFISMQNHYSLCYREEEREMNPFCMKNGIGLMAYAPLNRGLLSRPAGARQTAREEVMRHHPLYAEPSNADVEIISRVQAISTKRGWTMTQVALAWVISRGSIPVVGLSTSDRLQEAVGLQDKSLSSEDLAFLEAPYRPREIEGHR